MLHAGYHSAHRAAVGLVVPAIVSRFGVGCAFNVANPIAWLVIAAIVAAPAGLAAIAAAAGM